jgi:hypothetical protein
MEIIEDLQHQGLMKKQSGETTENSFNEMFDMQQFLQNNKQLFAWIQDLDINPYTLDPFN